MKKFVYGILRQGARAKEYETAIMWLTDCGLLRKVSRINKPNIPLKAYEDLKAFKLFMVDDGERVIPVEVKAEVNLKAKSLKTYREKYRPEWSVRTSMADYKVSDGLVDLPLYLIEG